MLVTRSRDWVVYWTWSREEFWRENLEVWKLEDGLVVIWEIIYCSTFVLRKRLTMECICQILVLDLCLNLFFNVKIVSGVSQVRFKVSVNICLVVVVVCSTVTAYSMSYFTTWATTHVTASTTRSLRTCVRDQRVQRSGSPTSLSFMKVFPTVYSRSFISDLF